ncbi:MAG: 4Fe-4S cluster-binding domain-containing protein, partial [Rhodospirillales bacterium]|nr:4Fe-4S cluster-binding domain-containing protein [Rhodospirillales bacterium]
PSVMMVEITNACNLACTGCALQMEGSVSMQANRKMIDFDMYTKLVDDVQDDLIFLVPYLGGESFLNKQMFDAIKYASDRGISVSATTAASFDHIKDFGQKISDSGLDFLFFSISGTEQEIYENFHVKGELAKVIANIKDVTRFPKSQRPRVCVRYLRTPYNAEDIKKLPEFTKELGADFFEIRQVDGTLEAVDTMTSKEEGISPEDFTESCPWLWASTVIKANGEVIPCCFDYYGVPEMGAINALDKGIRDVWNGEGYKKFRSAWYKGGSELDCCAQCRPSLGYQDTASVERAKQYVRTERM